MKELAKKLRQNLIGMGGFKVEVQDDEIQVFKSNDIITEFAAFSIFRFAKENHLHAFINVSFSGHLKFVLYND